MKKNSNQPDVIDIDQAIGKSEAFIIKYKNMIIAAIVAIIVLVGGSIIYQTQIAEPKAKEAAESIFAAQNLFNEQNFEAALNGDSVGNMGFIEIIDQYGGTPSANLAKAYAGISLAQLGRYEEAISYLKDFSGKDQMVAPAVIGALGNCYANTGNLSSAVKYFLEAAKIADNNSISPYYLMQAGLIYEEEGKKTDALKVYNTIKEKYFNSYQAMEIDKYIQRVK